MAMLVILTADGLESPVTLEPGTYQFGRDPACAVQIDHASVSSHHCEISLLDDGRMLVRDLESTNGTYIEREPITNGVVRPGQTLTLGAVEIRYQTWEAPTPSQSSAADQIDGAHSGSCLAMGGPPTEQSSADTAGSARPPVLAGGATPRVGAQTRALRGRMTDKLGRSPTALELTTSASVSRESFYRLIPGAFAYPFGGNAGMLIVGLTALMIIPALLPGPLAYLGMIAGFYAGLYLFAYVQDVILTSAKGDEETPKLPTLSLDRAEILELVWKFYVPVVFCFGAPILCRIYASDLEPWVVPTLFAAGCVYFPMAILAVVMSDDPGALNPIYVIPAMLRAPVAYLTLVVLFGGIGAITSGFEQWLGPALETQRWLAKVLSAAGGILQLYLGIAFARILGFFYYCFEERLGWFAASNDED